MRLTKIKLAGFKSFVDPTVFHVPGALVGIVGPNGCGKSNIIDAVRWVMGESSARNLRGGSMADVIFNGSSSRKPVGQASVELVFDNGEGRLTGPWGQYAEIAIKRQVGRDGHSVYLINGTRCRRRDITDVFLGTGLGPRSYSIIEQGMISRVIEARPEELRAFFEEAAGISRYKERRRETETRIRHARENLERLTDVREELDRQLQHLQRQARVAEQYRSLRGEEQRLRAELLALRWRALAVDAAARAAAMRERETAIEAELATLRQREAHIEADRERQHHAQQALEELQRSLYAVGSDVTRLEQQLQHQQELQRRQELELRQLEAELSQQQAHAVADRERLERVGAELAVLEPALEEAVALDEAAALELADAEAASAAAQGAWEGLVRGVSEVQRAADVEHARIEQLERQLDQQRVQIERLALEAEGLDVAAAGDELEDARAQVEVAVAETREAAAVLEDVDEALQAQRVLEREVAETLDAARGGLQVDRGRLASLETLQKAALEDGDARQLEWLAAQGLADAPRLADRLQVEPGWGLAVEAALGGAMLARCVDQIEPYAAALQAPPTGRVWLVEAGACASPPRALAARLRPQHVVGSLLDGVQAADSLDDALARRAGLAPGSVLVTPEGTRVGRDWIAAGQDGAAGGVLERNAEIRGLRERLEADAEGVEQLAQRLRLTREGLAQAETARREAEQAVSGCQRRLAQGQAELRALEARIEQQRARAERLEAQRLELQALRTETSELMAESRERLQERRLELERLDAERGSVEAQRSAARGALDALRGRAREAQARVQELRLTGGRLQADRAGLSAALERLDAQRAKLVERLGPLREAVTAGDGPLTELQLALDRQLRMRLEVEEGLAGARRHAEEIGAALRASEQQRAALEAGVAAQREALQAQRVALAELAARRDQLLEQYDALEGAPQQGLEDVLAGLPAEAGEQAWQHRLEVIAQRIQRLGAINLAAIDEHAELSERKGYLDAQQADLVEALETLEGAIRKIDRDTRSRFRETYDQVDARLRELFPRLFGGGAAHLELSDDDLLEAGVTIMARPPGKRVSNIHLLSGGEKALTAVALVFAIFQLNPAPFCMLDEVDAPLDEANVGRFGTLVREMSERVQFVFISHNKATMEIASHLVGVTMHEPGVSRLVAVDVDEALRMAQVEGAA